ncbi:MAG TPA: FAD binding domain-containing protein [Actinophytocola sp.]|uniref:FAD binding domain-containing protein n=1 Tax=Actinophytocola sp. TaxID=1872138 RepID=UPI002DBF9F17|nr:FAD binding domain-containing protein [Actinophytocola sp.]HEU5470954.1 FAD binding domain-containing protein [Actinophytocola sp.]
MRVLRPTDLPTALRWHAEHPVTPVMGGTDVLVALGSGRLRPATLLDLSLIPELRARRTDGNVVRIGAGLPYTEIAERLGDPLPGLASVARLVGSRQVRNRGTLGGSLGTAAPAADPHPMLLAAGASVELVSVRGTRRVPTERFYRSPGRTARDRDELIAAIRVPVATGPQWFVRAGIRRGMTKSICSCAIVLAGGRVSVALGGYGPVPVRATAAEEFLGAEPAGAARLDDDLVDEFGRLVAAAAEPVTDLHATAGYRRHAVAVLARRGLRAVWRRRCGEGPR